MLPWRSFQSSQPSQENRCFTMDKICCILAILLAWPAIIASASTPIVLTSFRGLQVHILPIGATIQRLIVPNEDGVAEDVVLGYDDPNRYQVHFCHKPSPRADMSYDIRMPKLRTIGHSATG